MKVNIGRRQIFVHCCALDLHCWKEMHRLGSPMRLHVGKKFWDIPILTRYANWRTMKVWDWDNCYKRDPETGELVHCKTGKPYDGH